MYYRWRNPFLDNAAQIFETATTNRREERLAAEVSHRYVKAGLCVLLYVREKVGAHARQFSQNTAQ